MGRMVSRPRRREGVGSGERLAEMLAFIVVGQNPYAAVVDKEGRFSIKGVPAGTYSISVWNSHLKAADKKVTVSEGQAAEVSFSLHR